MPTLETNIGALLLEVDYVATPPSNGPYESDEDPQIEIEGIRVGWEKFQPFRDVPYITIYVFRMAFAKEHGGSLEYACVKDWHEDQKAWQTDWALLRYDLEEIPIASFLKALERRCGNEKS